MLIDPSDVELDTTPSAPVDHPPRRSSMPWHVGAGALLIVGAAAWWFMSGREAPQPLAPREDPAAALFVPAHGSGSICPSVEGLPLPRLDETDGFAGALASTLSQHPRVIAWLATDDLIRRFVTVVDAVASGKSPAIYLGPLRPTGAFRTTTRGDGLLIDPRNEARFASMAEAVMSVDVDAAARVCSALKLRLDDAYGELTRGGTFDRALERAIVTILETPAVGPDARLVPQGARFGFEDPALESLTPAQKQLARMGTRHAIGVQNKLREIALAIGIPSARLPQ